jgi:hypothetical protein
MNPLAPKIIRIDRRTRQPDSVYLKREGDAKICRALGLKHE